MLNKRVYRAMTQQVERVNYARRIEELERLLHEARERIRQLEQNENHSEVRPGEHMIAGKAVMTLKAAAEAAGVSYSTAWRRCSGQVWQAHHDDSGRWHVFVDQVLL